MALFPYTFNQYFDEDGKPLNAGTIEARDATTGAKKDWFINAQGTVASNPSTLSASGRLTRYLDTGTYDFLIKDSLGNLIDTVEDVSGTINSGNGSIQYVENISQLRGLGSGGTTYVEVAGYYSKGDGGGGFFYWDSTSSSADDNGIIFQPNSLPATGRWIRSFVGKINVRWFGAKGDGSTDDSISFQNAINYALTNHNIMYIPASTYAINDTLTVYNGTQIEGDLNFSYNDGFGRDEKSTKIIFSPTSSKNLFNYEYTGGGTSASWLFLFHTSIQGLSLQAGNTNASSALYLDHIIYGRYKNLVITGFEVGVQCLGTINNKFEQCFIYGCTKYDIWYRGLAETTDVWDNCTINGEALGSPSIGAGATTPIGVKIGTDAADGTPTGNTIAIRFINCLWESIQDFGMDIDQGANAIEVIGGYCEDVSWYSAEASACMFRVGYTTNGSLANGYNLKVIGGSYSGAQLGPSGDFLNIDNSNGVVITGFPSVNRFGSLINTDPTNTKSNSVQCGGFGGISYGTIIDDTSKISGIYPNTTMDQATFDQVAKFRSLDISDPTGFINMYANATIRVGDSNPEGVVSASPGSIYMARLGGANDTFFVKESGTGNTGWVNYRPAQPSYSGVILGSNGVQMTSLSSAVAFSNGGTGNGAKILAGAGSPEGATTAEPGSLWLGASGGAGVSLYVKESKGTVINAGSFIVGQPYEILTVGTTDFTLIGAADNNIGTKFTATGVGAGTGTAYKKNTGWVAK